MPSIASGFHVLTLIEFHSSGCLHIFKWCREFLRMMHRSVRVLGTFVGLSLVLAGFPSGVAFGGTVVIQGPVGALIEIDGREIGTLPLLEPLTLDEGTYRVVSRLQGHLDYEELIDVGGADHGMAVRISHLARQRTAPVVYSLLLAGLGQHHLGKPNRGWVFMGVELAAAGVAILGEAQFKGARDDLVDAQVQYDAAVSGDDVAFWRGELNKAQSDLDSAETMRNLALGAVIGTAVLSAIDAWLQFDKVFTSAGPDLASGRGTEMRVGWVVDF